MTKTQVLEFLERIGTVTITNIFKDDYFKYIELALNVSGKTKYLELSYIDESDVEVEVLRSKSDTDCICMNAFYYTLEDLYLEGLQN